MFPFQFNPEDGLEPADVRFVDVHVEPWDDNRRVRIHSELTPFKEKPSLEFTILDASGKDVSSVAVIENIELKFVITMHIRGAEAGGKYRLLARIFYPELPEVDQREISFELPTN
ncbi:MAG: hypothetical protein ABFD44_07190 [Anaerolineaceae bacterium]